MANCARDLITCLHRLNSLKLAKECNESLFKLVSEGPLLVYVKELEERLERIEENGKVAKQHF